MQVNEKEILQAFDKNRPYLIDIEKLVNRIKYGMLNISLTIHDSKVTGFAFQSTQKVRYEVGQGGSMVRVSEELPNPNLKIDEQV